MVHKMNTMKRIIIALLVSWVALFSTMSAQQADICSLLPKLIEDIESPGGDALDEFLAGGGKRGQSWFITRKARGEN